MRIQSKLMGHRQVSNKYLPILGMKDRLQKKLVEILLLGILRSNGAPLLYVMGLWAGWFQELT